MASKTKPAPRTRPRRDGRTPYHLYLNEEERARLEERAVLAGRTGADVLRRWLMGLRP